MTLLRLLNVQGIAGLAVSLALGLLLVLQKGETRHWRKQSGSFEQLYQREQASLSATIADYRAAAAEARVADLANAQRAAAEQRAINERSAHDYQTRLVSARARADELRRQPAAAAADSRAGRGAAVPSLAAASGRADQAAGQDGLPDPDALIATEQAIQLDELIKWVKAQAAVTVAPAKESSHPR